METPSAELCSCRRDKHVVAFCRTKICPTRNAGDWDADVVKIGRTVLMCCQDFDPIGVETKEVFVRLSAVSTLDLEGDSFLLYKLPVIFPFFGFYSALQYA